MFMVTESSRVSLFARLLLRPWRWGHYIPKKRCKRLSDYTMSHPRRYHSSRTPTGEPQITHSSSFACGSRTMIALLCSSETSVNIYQSTGYHIPEDGSLRSHLCENPWCKHDYTVWKISLYRKRNCAEYLIDGNTERNELVNLTTFIIYTFGNLYFKNDIFSSVSIENV
jgi:hypothetical protein